MKTGLATDEQGTPFASTVERETKLLVDDSFRLPRLRGRALPRRVFTSTYYDTPDHCLARAHVTLRYRLEGRLGAWQLKLPLNGSRREIEVRGEAGQVPDVFTKALVVLLEGKSMVRIATLRTWRTGVRVPLGGRADADVVLDSVSVMGGGRVIQQFSELEIEWLHGEQPEREFLTELLKTAGAKPHDGRP
ncbi:MAG TPA: CYTH domain-containing protein, partial [Nitrospira sp.]|nr:CYTH domain-containing protein [Nitrospira sp.]